ncbi:hypothetical protein LTR66_001474 [Elasticomyces elasticus]|nr:hypothetical protein LTR28_005265 [Elasticomyces elasticus]KAK4999496.1 hypothetical protein LTR66_001474 [Elasticomyces elasticus]
MSTDGMSKKAILVIGATGKQGGATINALIEDGALKTHTLLAVTRDPDSTTARKLAGHGVRLVQGDLTDCNALFRNAKTVLEGGSVWGVFSVQPAGKREEAQGKALVDAAVASNVDFFVYTSVDRGGEVRSPRNATKVPHFASKHRIEQHLRLASRNDQMKWTILRPVAFMENLAYAHGFEGKVMATAWRISLGNKPLQLVATQDIGWFAAQALLRPDDFASRSISVAGDEMSFAQANAIFKSKVGYEMPQTSALLTRFIMWLAGDLGAMIRWFAAEGYGADLASLRAEHSDLLSFEEWVVESGWVK